MSYRCAALVLLALPLVGCAADAAPDASAPAADEADYTSGKKLLDCNVFMSGGGPDQQVTVLRTKTGLVLRELTDHGATEERALTEAEWTSKKLRLRKDPSDFGTVTSTLTWDSRDKAWSYMYRTSYWQAVGFADCD